MTKTDFITSWKGLVDVTRPFRSLRPLSVIETFHQLRRDLPVAARVKGEFAAVSGCPETSISL